MSTKGTRGVAIVIGLVVIVGIMLLWDRLRDPPGTRPENVMSLSEVQRVFSAEDGWIALPLAESRYQAGTIIQVDTRGVRRISHLDVCGYPDSVIVPDTSHLLSLRLERELQLGVGVIGTVEGARLGPSTRRARAVSAVIDSITTESIDVLQIRIWQDEDANFDVVSPLCLRQFAEPNIYVVAEAARVNAGTYTFYDSAWAKIEATADNLPDFIDLGGDASAAATEGGAVRIVRPVTVAIRNAQWVGDQFRRLAPGDTAEVRNADELLRSIIARQAAAVDSVGG